MIAIPAFVVVFEADWKVFICKGPANPAVNFSQTSPVTPSTKAGIEPNCGHDGIGTVPAADGVEQEVEKVCLTQATPLGIVPSDVAFEHKSLAGGPPAIGVTLIIKGLFKLPRVVLLSTTM